ncbi:Hypothetical protein POVR1_LOCUS144 [uncultured virus]|nr:Hypothetical protein POVR1_LOCUS144 [uncultured virus]
MSHQYYGLSPSDEAETDIDLNCPFVEPLNDYHMIIENDEAFQAERVLVDVDHGYVFSQTYK